MAMYPASRLGSERHTLSVLVENRPGVLARIAGLFARRAFNINSLSVSPTERPDISRVTVTADVEAVPLEQIIKQLNKLLHVAQDRRNSIRTPPWSVNWCSSRWRRTSRTVLTCWRSCACSVCVLSM